MSKREPSAEILVAVIAGLFAICSAAVSAWNSYAIAGLQRQKDASYYTEPLAWSAFQLQSRLRNILADGFISEFLRPDNERSSLYVVENTAYVIADYFCWSDIVQHSMQYIDLADKPEALNISQAQRDIVGAWRFDGDGMGPRFRFFAGEQQAIGQALARVDKESKSDCVGYGAFLTAFPPKSQPLIEALRDEIRALKDSLDPASRRLTYVQNGLVDLLGVIDPAYRRFQEKDRQKVAQKRT